MQVLANLFCTGLYLGSPLGHDGQLQTKLSHRNQQVALHYCNQPCQIVDKTNFLSDKT